MKRSVIACALAFALLGAAGAPAPKLSPVPHNAQTAVVNAYLRDLQNGAYADAFALLNDQARAYYRNAVNFRSIYDADGYHVQKYTLLGTRGDAAGRVFSRAKPPAFAITRTIPT